MGVPCSVYGGVPAVGGECPHCVDARSIRHSEDSTITSGIWAAVVLKYEYEEGAWSRSGGRNIAWVLQQ